MRVGPETDRVTVLGVIGCGMSVADSVTSFKQLLSDQLAPGLVSDPMRSVTWKKMIIVIIISNKQWTFPEIPNFQYFHFTSSLLHYFRAFPHLCYSISLLSFVSRLANCALSIIIELNNCIVLLSYMKY